jgi:hypothetical protein
VIAHDQIGEAAEGFLCRVGMNGGQRTGMARVEGIEKRSSLDSAHFAQDDPVRSPPESGLQKVIERDVDFERIALAFDRQDVRLLDMNISHTEWHRCVVFGKLSEFAKTLTKGAHIRVEGELRCYEYDSKKTDANRHGSER